MANNRDPKGTGSKGESITERTRRLANSREGQRAMDKELRWTLQETANFREARRVTSETLRERVTLPDKGREGE